MTRRKNDPVGEPPGFRNKLQAAPAELSEQDRDNLRAHLATHAAKGYKAALAAVGYHAPHKEARALILGDDELKQAYLAGYRLDEPSVFQAVGDILSDPDHKDRLRAATWAANAIHRWAEKTEADVNHGGEVNNPDVAAALDRFTALAAAAVRAASRDDEAGPPRLTE